MYCGTPGCTTSLGAWARSAGNPGGGWYGLKKGLRGRFAMYVPPAGSPKWSRIRGITGCGRCKLCCLAVLACGNIVGSAH
ncbi:MAG: DUF6855 family protein [Bryobacteraceae bacterium]